jgi:uncharacterized protein YgiM (DUF1202 family)
MRPSTLLPYFVLRFFALAISLGSATALAAQARVVTTPAAVLASPNGKAIGSIHPGASLRVIETRGAYAKVSIDGFVERTRLSAQRGSTAPRVGSKSATVRSRAATAARSVASLDAGTTVSLATGATPAGWARVSRSGWVLKTSLDRAPEAARVASNERRAASSAKKPSSAGRKASAGEVASTTAAPKRPIPTRPTPILAGSSSTAPTPRTEAPTVFASAASLGDSALVPTANVALRAAPDAKALATVVQGTALIPLARDRGWVRVRLEGWVPERDVAPADSGVRMGVSAADLRADPVGNRGKVVRWSVQVLARQRADALRKDLALDETYLLARGPYEENALLYLVVPPSLMVTTKSIPELSQVMITARVRTGRSELVGVPILDLLTITARK